MQKVITEENRMSLNDVISQYEEELLVFDIVKDDVNVLVDVGCRENYDYAQIKPEAKMYLFDVNEIFINNLSKKIEDKCFNIIALPFGLSNRNADVTISEQTESIQPHRQWGETQLSGRIRRFDEVIEEYAINRIDFLKMDIEGCEPDLLEFTDIMKNIKYIQFEFGRAWPDLNQYGIGEVMKQYEDTHDFFFIKDKNHPTTNTIDAPLFTLITEPVLNELNHHLINDRWGYGGNILMVNKNINFDYKKINEDNKPKPKAKTNSKPKVIVYQRKK
tara:strand:- start:10 stop:834 length:825 start_codon:yes stop_codon:yes gene_type:complete